MRLFSTRAFLLCLSCLGVQLSASAQHSIGNPEQGDPLQLGIPRPTLAQRRIANPQKLTLTTTQRSDNRCNLVANGDFEIQFANTPPSQDGNIQSPITTSANQLPSWFAPNYTSPDYLARNGVLDNPPNPSRYSPAGSFRGAVTPLNGSNPATQDGTVGIVYSTLVPGYNSYPEYIAQNLAAPLTPNALYYAEFYAQPASQFSQARALRLYVADNTNGAAVDNNNASVLNSPYGITSPVLTNLGSWQRVSGTFTTGAGPYNFLGIGYDNPSANNNTPLNNGAPQSASYYYLDDVALYKVPTVGPVTITTSCNGPLTIGEGCDIPNAQYTWTSNPSSSTPLPATIQIQVNPQVTTVYTLTVTLPDGTTTSSSVTVTASSPSAGPNQTICPNQSATLGQDGCLATGYTYAWYAPSPFISIGGGPSYSKTPFSTALHPIVSPSQTTTYKLVVRRPDGTSYTSYVTVTVLDLVTNAPDINLAQQGQPGPSGSNLYDVRVNNVSGVTSFTYYLEIPDGNGGWTVSGSTPSPLSANVYTGPDNASFNELAGFTTFHTGLIGPASSGSTSGGSINNPATYRITVTAQGACNQIVAQKVVTLPPAGGGGEESSLLAYPNPATETLNLPVDATNAVLLNSQGRPVKIMERGSTLDVQRLPAGLYNLRIMRDGKIINQHIEVKH